MKEHGYKLSKLGELTNINNGHLSGFLRGNPLRVLTINQLDSITKIFGEMPGWLYDLYIDECFPKGRVSRRRLCPYLIRCAEIGRYDCVKSVVSRLLDNSKNIDIIYFVAEKLFQQRKRRESIYFYQVVIENEKNSYSERFIMSQYRLFRALQGTNTEENWNAVIRFEPYWRRLSEAYQLDALLQLANTCYTLHKWQEVEKYADSLIELSTLIYRNEKNKRKSHKESELFNTERHLVVYYGQGFLLKSIALQKQEMYVEAKEYVRRYADLGWFEFSDDVSQKEIENFRICAKANMFTLELLLGNTSVLDEYVEYLKNHPSEIHAGLLTILESANKHKITIDEVLENFIDEIQSFDDYQNNISIDRHFALMYELAIYRFRNGQFKSGIDTLLNCLALSHITNNNKNFKRCVALLESYRILVTDCQDKEYKKIIEEVLKDEDIFTFTMFNPWIVR
ncbi:DNA-binding protein [Brevibacillus laterosporus]|uniref:DNA-binding protein n=1 Tax=Brevibacillus laterosporus TaxID=1465 RepID=UPI003D1FF226